MRNKKIVMIVMCFLVILSGCSTTHYGKADPSVPIKEQCLLYIDSTVAVRSFNGKNVKWNSNFFSHQGSISIPAGEHSFYVTYTYTKDHRTSGNYLYYTQVTAYDTINYTFKPGCTYEMAIWGDKVQIRSVKTEDPRSVIIAPEIHWLGMGVGRDYGNTIKWDIFSMQLGKVIESNALTTGLFWDIGLLGIGGGIDSGDEHEFNDFGVPVYTGVSCEFYLPGKPFGFGVGGGITSNLFWIPPIAPYLRAEIIPFKGSTKMVAYFDYYLPDIVPFESGYLFTTNNWGLGLIWYYW